MPSGGWASAPFGREIHCPLPWAWLGDGERAQKQHQMDTCPWPSGPLTFWRGDSLEEDPNMASQKVKPYTWQSFWLTSNSLLTTGLRIISFRISLIRVSNKIRKLDGKCQVTNLSQNKGHVPWRFSPQKFPSTYSCPSKARSTTQLFPQKGHISNMGQQGQWICV